MPVIGSKPTAPPRLITTCIKTHAPNPENTSFLNSLSVDIANPNNEIIKRPRIIIKITNPTNPYSSPIMDAIKSV